MRGRSGEGLLVGFEGGRISGFDACIEEDLGVRACIALGQLNFRLMRND